MEETNLQAEKYRKMTETPVERLVCRMAVPTIVSMLVTALYNMVDTWYVGFLNTQATAAIGICFSFMAIIQAVGFFFGHGSGNAISRLLGQRKTEEASRMAATGFFSALIGGGLLTAAGFVFLTPLSRLLGAIDSVLPYTQDYLGTILLGAPYMTAAFVLNNQLRLQGNAFFSMIGIASGAVLNTILDPLFIFVLGLEVKGAALATILSQLISFILLLLGCGKGGSLRMNPRHFSPSFARYREIFGGGLPSLCRQGLASFATICLNQSVGVYGDSAIAAFSIVTRITNFASSALLGFGQGFQPVCGFNYGAKLYHRVKKAFWFCVKLSTVVLTALAVLGYLFAPELVALFRKGDELLIEIGAQTLRYQCLSLPFVGLVILSNMLLQNIRATVKASVLSIARQGMFFLPLLFLLHALLGLPGIQLAQPAADIATFLLAVPFCRSVLNGMK